MESEDMRRNWQRSDQDWIQGNFSSAKEWNSLPAEVVNAESVNSFKNCLPKTWRDSENGQSACAVCLGQTGQAYGCWNMTGQTGCKRKEAKMNRCERRKSETNYDMQRGPLRYMIIQVRKYSNIEYHNIKTASTIATSIVHSKLDYCNSLYYNLPNSQLSRLQLTAIQTSTHPKLSRSWSC